MNKWKIAGNEECWRISSLNLATQATTSVDSTHQMPISKALCYVMEQAQLGDMITLPDGTPLSVYPITGIA